MRPLVVTTFLSLDGVAQAPGGPTEDPSGGFELGGWLVPHFDEVMGRQMEQWFAGAEDFLLGRRTYEIFAAHWPRVPTDGDRISWSLNTLPRHVASRTLDHLDWDGAQLVDGDVGQAVRALTAQDGGELQVHGSIGLAQTLLAEDLVDELRLVVFPVSLGSGRRLFADGTVPRTWQLVSSAVSSTGAFLVAYRRTGGVATGSFQLDQG